MSITAVPIQPVKRGYVVWLWIGIAAALVIAMALAWKGTAGVVAETGTNAQFLAYNAGQPAVVETDSGLQYQVLEAGKGGATPGDDDLVLVNYSGKLRDGRVFDESRQPTPMSPKSVVPGFAEALKLMPKGAKYRVWMKPDLAYGAEARIDPQTGEEAIPADALLIFDIEMVDFMPEAVVRQMQMQQMMQMQQGQGGAPVQGVPEGAAPPQP
ncbi:FKBP-type peptidyl-prolyl cis-trans isomerase [Sphingomonas sp.]|uniref:FKBP-type peptidyl-prolyl cis-trans isomerase n=1 Tax=Sphingomonas sp. TaxID=28214 RepID=UPI002C208F14|nr:FKBP-type peptidyl-prolyl cis-trans isomerase [Sphingomonas sp.]HTG38212.1 FKBP-type peptidyl-prolyl cis-trans isomerase [Sphingomonas sp.]